MQSSNYKISEDIIDFGKAQGGADNYRTQQGLPNALIATASQITGRVVPLPMLLLVLLAAGILLIFLIKKFQVNGK